VANGQSNKQNDELKQLSKLVGGAIELTERQLDNIGQNYDMLLLSLLSLGGTVAIQVVSKLLIIWVPTSFFLAVLWIIWPQFSQFKAYLTANKLTVFAGYDKLRDEQKQLGIETSVKRVAPFSYALAVVYFIGAIILVLNKTGVVESPATFSIWLPLVSLVLLIVWIGAGPAFFRHVTVRDFDKVLRLYRTKFANIATRRILMAFAIMIVGIVSMIAINLALPIWSLILTQDIYTIGTNWLLILLFLTLEIIVFAQISGYLTYLSARTELSTNVANLSNLDLRINQLLASNQISTDEVATITKQYHEAIKYRFVHILVLRFIRIYMPVLNEAYVQAQLRGEISTPDEKEEEDEENEEGKE
jgi:hypothetical protein